MSNLFHHRHDLIDWHPPVPRDQSATIQRATIRWVTDDAPLEDAAHLPRNVEPKRRRTRKPSLVSVAKQAAKAGIEVRSYEVDLDGKITVVTGKPDDKTTAEPDTKIDASEWN